MMLHFSMVSTTSISFGKSLEGSFPCWVHKPNDGFTVTLVHCSEIVGKFYETASFISMCAAVSKFEE